MFVELKTPDEVFGSMTSLSIGVSSSIGSAPGMPFGIMMLDSL